MPLVSLPLPLVSVVFSAKAEPRQIIDIRSGSESTSNQDHEAGVAKKNEATPIAFPLFFVLSGHQLSGRSPRAGLKRPVFLISHDSGYDFVWNWLESRPRRDLLSLPVNWMRPSSELADSHLGNPVSLKRERKMSQKKVPTWEALVAKRMSQHFRQFHAAEAAPGRRSFLRTMAGLGLSSGLLMPGLAQAGLNQDRGGGEDDGDALPKPIPGGTKPLGIFVHHFPLPPPGTRLADLTEPSQITDFKGFIGNTTIRGAGIGTTDGVEVQLAFKSDMGFMKGKYIGEDGRHHHGTFAFI
jgi:hypothetical protein